MTYAASLHRRGLNAPVHTTHLLVPGIPHAQIAVTGSVGSVRVISMHYP